MSLDRQDIRAKLDALDHPKTLDDAALEAAIDLAALRLQTATTPLRRRHAFDELRTLVAQRSPQQIARMERDKGLAP